MLGAQGSHPRGGVAALSNAGARANDGKGTTAMRGLVESAIDRLEEAVAQETAALQSRQTFDLKEFNDRKSRGLLELTRAMRLIEGTPPDAALINRLAGLRAKLEANSAVLKLHLDAVREISAAMAEAMRDADSDGTYSRPLGGGKGR
jgi:hypothetical protein